MAPSTVRPMLNTTNPPDKEVSTYTLWVFDLTQTHHQAFVSLAEEFECDLEYHTSLLAGQTLLQHTGSEDDRIPLVYMIFPDDSPENLLSTLKPNKAFFETLPRHRACIVPRSTHLWFGLCRELEIEHLLSAKHSAFLDQLYHSVSLFHQAKQLVGLEFQQEQKGWQWWTVQSTEDILNYSKQTMDLLNPILCGRANELQTTLFEALTNAVYHAPRHKNGEEKYHKAQSINYLPAKDRAFLALKQLTHSADIIVQDQWGTLTPAEVWQWMEENTREDALFATHGRGFFLMYLLMDGLQVDIAPKRGTRVTFQIQQHPSEEDAPYKALFLNHCITP
ncbi:MAG: ATP-binding protein [Vampirovibrionales bacterium]